MGEDASLDEFLGGDGAGGGGADGEAAAGEAPVDDDGADAEGDGDTGTTPEADGEPPLAPDAVDPATTTYEHSPGGAPCAACGVTVTERWQDAPGMVCPDCKEW
jgi:hypothetical protein